MRKKNEELKMMAEKKRFEEEAKQKQIEAEMEQELKRQAHLKLQQQQLNQEMVWYFLFLGPSGQVLALKGLLYFPD